MGALVGVTANGTQILAPVSPPTVEDEWVQVTSDTFVTTQSSYDFVIAATPQVNEADTMIDDVHLQQVTPAPNPKNPRRKR
jgi:hypothetical protein